MHHNHNCGKQLYVGSRIYVGDGWIPALPAGFIRLQRVAASCGARTGQSLGGGVAALDLLVRLQHRGGVPIGRWGFVLLACGARVVSGLPGTGGWPLHTRISRAMGPLERLLVPHRVSPLVGLGASSCGCAWSRDTCSTCGGVWCRPGRLCDYRHFSLRQTLSMGTSAGFGR